MGKKLKINCAACDVRNVREEVLAAYDSVSINCATILATPESQALMSRYAVKMNCADALVLEKEVQIKTINGKAKISPTDAALPFYYIINGMLQIEPGTEAVMSKCVGMTVNGMVMYPQSMAGFLGKMNVNGKAVCYPDEAVLLKKEAVIDRVFALRAKDRLYWAAKRLILVDPRLDPEALAKKGARFSAPEAIIAESKVEGLIELIDERTEIVIVPDGTAVVNDDVELDETTLQRYGNKIYILGDVTVKAAAAGAVEQLEYLNIRGDVITASNVKAELLKKAESIEGDVQVYYGKVYRDVPELKINTDLLTLEEDGITVVACAIVKIDPEIPAGMILEKLHILECAVVECTPEQRAAVSSVCQNVPVIGERKDIAEHLDEDEDDSDTVKINTANYIM